MASLLDMLIGAQSAAPAQAPAAQPIASAAAPVDDITVTAPPNYSNATALSRMQSATQADKPQAAGNDVNPGVWGMLPPNIQHGTLRNVLGSLGDAFLAGSHEQPIYRPRMERQELGNLSVGFDQKPQETISRIEASGLPGSMELGNQMRQQYNEQQLKKQMQEQSFEYKSAMINDRNQGVFSRQAPIVMGAVSAIKDPQKYNQMYSLWDARAKTVDPSSDASTAYGIPKPEDWQPGQLSGYGMTSNNQQVSADKAAGRQQSGLNAQTNAGARITAASIGAGTRTPTTSQYDAQLLSDYAAGKPMNAAQQARVAKLNAISGHGARPLLVGNTNSPHQTGFQEGQVYTDAHGNKAKYHQGQWIPQ